MPRFKSKVKMYQYLRENAGSVVDEAVKVANASEKTTIQNTLEKEPPTSHKGSLSELFQVLSNTLGDTYTACPFTSREWALRACAEMALSPSWQNDSGQHTYLTPLLWDSPLYAAFGSPFPPKYGYLGRMRSNRSQALAGLPLLSVRASIVPLQGASYPFHGIYYSETPFTCSVNPESSIQVFASTANIHSSTLSGIVTSGRDTAGCGLGLKENGIPVLLRDLGELALEYDIPLIVDSGVGFLFLGQDPRAMHLSAFAIELPIKEKCVLVLGPESFIQPLKEWIGIFNGTHNTNHLGIIPDPASISEAVRFLLDIQDNPGKYTRLVDITHEIVVSELSVLDSSLKQSLSIDRSYGNFTIEINYENTWKDGIGFPVFSPIDDLKGTNLINRCLDLLGITSIRSKGPNLYISPLSSGETLPNEDKIRHHVRLLLSVMVSIGRQVGFLD
jgi:hypothetical protein